MIENKGWNNGDVRWYSDIEDETRLKPAGTFVIKSKAWVRIKSGTCYWPSIVYIRRPFNSEGVSYLQDEPRVFIEPFGEGKLFLRPYINGMWIRATSVSPFDVNNARRRRVGLDTKTKALSDLFEDAIHMCDQSKIPAIKFNFDGTFDCSHLKKKTSHSLIVSSTKPTVCPDVESMFEPSQTPSKRMIREINVIMHDLRQSTGAGMKQRREAAKKRKRDEHPVYKEVVMMNLAESFLQIANTNTNSLSGETVRTCDAPTVESISISTSKETSTTSQKRRSKMPPQKVVIKIEK